MIGNIYGGISSVGGLAPESARTALGRALMAAEQQQINQMLAPVTSGLLGQ
jgi:hypothetical protein